MSLYFISYSASLCVVGYIFMNELSRSRKIERFFPYMPVVVLFVLCLGV